MCLRNEGIRGEAIKYSSNNSKHVVSNYIMATVAGEHKGVKGKINSECRECNSDWTECYFLHFQAAEQNRWI